ncbi:UDP-N-acetylmuramoyl-tripeptide--D-alanyl-D-alanine ligase [Persephonella atlantica]|uniref:UDP-N-acetylmuramoyl-tripeptide--D-alanyl-D-alanine ligase n=1 Tax=Persephonella atlantica TaxID=2699429 RepID=A0ABS1GG85_9AQUI|nr:UDP-N-acetylmuramoyl-tripeptide--D-alanyl-D-alanine ligase [Persephonella atlantica]MBK3331938.1 UDP-N-acetylmuramoyl-tripeptide--D-alanyl-D-alanine ligase [Persephonella atlantica]
MDIKTVLHITEGKADSFVNKKIKTFHIDSRKISEGDFFVPLKGEKHDGHDFIPDAVKRGASGFFTEKPTTYPNGILVENSLKALTQVGRFKRKQLKTAVGITGTAGKTTTKELLKFILSDFFPIYATEGNLNNEIGLPLTLANIPERAEVGIFEMGAGKIGDIRHLVNIAQPQIRILTAIGHGHTEKFGSLENVIKGKGEIFEGGEVCILPYSLLKHYRLKNFVTFGTEENADIKVISVKITERGTEGILSVKNHSFNIFIPVYSKALFHNLGAVFGVLEYMEISLQKAIEKLSDFSLPEGRGKIMQIGDFTIIDDTYNANPLSVENAIYTLSAIPKYRIIVLGDMLELGRYSQHLHHKIGKLIGKSQIDTAVFYGKEMKNAYEEASKKVRSFYFKSKDEVVEFLYREREKKPVILIKGSRGMKMEEIIHRLKC